MTPTIKNHRYLDSSSSSFGFVLYGKSVVCIRFFLKLWHRDELLTGGRVNFSLE